MDADRSIEPFHSYPFTLQHDLSSSLYYAAYIGLCEVVGHLLDRGADPNTCQASDTADTYIYPFLPFRYGNCLCAAARKGQTKICQLLLSRGARVDDTGKEAPTALWFAAHAGNVSTVRFLLQNGARVDAGAGSTCGTALIGALSRGHREIMRLLLESGAHVNAAGKHGATAFFFAAEQGSSDIIKYLLDHGADLERQNDKGETPLHAAAIYGTVDCITLLQERGANLGARRSYDGWTSLHEAVYSGQVAVIERLLSLRADIESFDNEVSKIRTQFRLSPSLLGQV